MAIVYPGPVADQASSPHRADHPTAGSRAVTAGRSGTWRIDLTAIAQGFAGSAGELTELRGLAERSWILLAATDLFEAWAIGWPPGGRIALHDHGASDGAVAVAAGTLTETTVRASRRGTVVIGTRSIPAGEQREFGAGYVHDLSNDSDSEAVSVHVYGPRLSTMRYYEVDGRGRLVVVRSDRVVPVGPFDTTGAHDPS